MQQEHGKAEHHFGRVLWELDGDEVMLSAIYFTNGTNRP